MEVNGSAAVPIAVSRCRRTPHTSRLVCDLKLKVPGWFWVGRGMLICMRCQGARRKGVSPRQSFGEQLVQGVLSDLAHGWVAFGVVPDQPH